MAPLESLVSATAGTLPAARREETALRAIGSVTPLERGGIDETRAGVGSSREDRAARTLPGQARPEVEISDEARARLESARAAASADADDVRAEALRAEEATRETRAAEREQIDESEEALREERALVEPTRFIAVRVGPVSPEELTAVQGAEAALSERARLREVSQVLSLPDRPDPRDAISSASATEQASERPDVTALPGLETRTPREGRLEEARSEAESRLPGRSEDSRATPAEDPRAGALLADATQERERDAVVEESARTEQVDQGLSRTASVAAQAGGVSEPREAARADASAPSSSDEGQRTERTEEERTQLGTGSLEADRADSIVTRFLGNVEAPDPGPVPSVRQVLGTRP